MANTPQAIRSYFHDHAFEYEFSKADLQRLPNAFDHWGGHLRQPRILDKAELRALADYDRTITKLFLAWKAISTMCHQEIKDRDGDAALQKHLDQLDALLEQAEALAVPDRAAAVQRVFVAMLGSERAYFQSVFDDVDDLAIGQHAVDFQEEAAMFLTEFDRLLHLSGQSLQRNNQ